MVFYSIFKRKKENGKGHYWYYCYTDPVRNVRVQKRCLGCATKREAYEYIGKLPKQIESEIIFKNYAAGYIERYEEQKNVKGYSVKKSSVKTRQTQLNILVSHWGEKKLASIFPSAVCLMQRQCEASATARRENEVLPDLILPSRSLSSTKTMQTSGKGACSYFPECSLSSTKIM